MLISTMSHLKYLIIQYPHKPNIQVLNSVFREKQIKCQKFSDPIVSIRHCNRSGRWIIDVEVNLNK